MKYMLLIQQSDTPTPRSPDEWGRLSEDEQKAVYSAYRERPALALTDRLELDRYHYLHATRAELLRRLDRVEEAHDAYECALDLVHSDAERRFLEQRLAELQG